MVSRAINANELKHQLRFPADVNVVQIISLIQTKKHTHPQGGNGRTHTRSSCPLKSLFK